MRPLFVLELHHRALGDRVRTARAPQRLQLVRRVRVAPAEAAARRFDRRLRLALGRARDGGAGRLPVDRQVAGLGEQLLQAQGRAGRHRPFDLAGAVQAAACRVTATARGSLTRSCEPSGAPRPDGREHERVAVGFAPAARACSATARAARAEHFATGLEKVRWIGVAGRSVVPAAGIADHHRELDGGNQLTCAGGPIFSHGRGAAATSTAPVAGRRRARRARRRASAVRRRRARPSVGDRAHRLIEAHAHRRGRGDGHPALASPARPGAQRQVLVAVAAERPAEPAGAADDDVHGDLLAGGQLTSGVMRPSWTASGSLRPSGPERGRARSCRRAAAPRRARAPSGRSASVTPDSASAATASATITTTTKIATPSRTRVRAGRPAPRHRGARAHLPCVRS